MKAILKSKIFVNTYLKYLWFRLFYLITFENIYLIFFWKKRSVGSWQCWYKFTSVKMKDPFEGKYFTFNFTSSIIFLCLARSAGFFSTTILFITKSYFSLELAVSLEKIWQCCHAKNSAFLSTYEKHAPKQHTTENSRI